MLWPSFPYAIRRGGNGAAGRAENTRSPGTPPLRPRRSSLRRAALPGAGGRRLPLQGGAPSKTMTIQNGRDRLDGYYDCIGRFHPESNNWPYRVIATTELTVKAPDWYPNKVSDEQLIAAYKTAKKAKLKGFHKIEASADGEIHMWDNSYPRPKRVMTISPRCAEPYFW